MTVVNDLIEKLKALPKTDRGIIWTSSNSRGREELHVFDQLANVCYFLLDHSDEIAEMIGGETTSRLDGNELWEIMFGVCNDNPASVISEDEFEEIAKRIVKVFGARPTHVTDAMVCAAMDAFLADKEGQRDQKLATHMELAISFVGQMKRMKAALETMVPVVPTTNCCVCGRIIDMREKEDGGDSFGAQLTDGRWTCSIECDDVLDDSSVTPEKLKKYAGDRLSSAINTQHDVSRSIEHVMEWVDNLIIARIRQEKRKSTNGVRKNLGMLDTEERKDT